MRESDLKSARSSTAPKQKRVKRESDHLPVDVCSLLFKEVDRPTNLVKCDAKNVYDNKYRVNIYTRHWDDVYQIERISLSNSFWCKVDNDQLLFGTHYAGKCHWHKDQHFVLPKKETTDSTPHTFTAKENDSPSATFSLKK